MSKSRLGPEAKIISLFTVLPDDSKRIVLDIIKSQSAAPRKASSKKATASAPAPKATKAENDSIPPGLCSYKYPEGHVCLAPADNAIHDKSFGYAGYHPFEPSKPVARTGRKSKLKPGETSSAPSSEIETETAIAAGAGD